MDAEHREQTLAVLGDCDLSYVCVDEPQGFASSVPPVALATNRHAVVRFHFRKREKWEQRTQTAAERFDYYYRADELAEWTERIEGLSDESDELHLVINTNNSDQGPVNARLLAEGLGKSRARVLNWTPPPPDEQPATDEGQKRLL
jgi:uncharacterized protein YecE (DUF72 family)